MQFTTESNIVVFALQRYNVQQTSEDNLQTIRTKSYMITKDIHGTEHQENNTTNVETEGDFN